MANKLFYTVNPKDADSFKNSNEPVIGFVTPDANEEFGYILVSGKQYGVSAHMLSYYAKKNEIDELIPDDIVTEGDLTTTLGDYAKSSALEAYAKADALDAYAKTDDLDDYVSKNDESQAKFVADGVNYTLKFTNGALSIETYIETTISKFELVAPTYDAVNTVDLYVWYGSSNTFTYGFNVTGKVKANLSVSNEGGNTFTLRYDSFEIGGSFSGNGAIHTSYDLSSILSISSKSANGSDNGAWAGTRTLKCTSNSVSTTAYLWEVGKYNEDNTTPSYVTKTDDVSISVSKKVITKYLTYFGEYDANIFADGKAITAATGDNSNWSSHNYSDALTGDKVVPAGKTYVYIVPAAYGKMTVLNNGFGTTVTPTVVYISSMNETNTVPSGKTGMEYHKYTVNAGAAEAKFTFKK